MKVTITTFPTQTEPERRIVMSTGGLESPSGLQATGQRRTQEAAGFRKAAITPIARQNRRNTITFKVTRLFDDPLAAELFILDHDGDIPEEGRIEFENDEGQEGQPFKRVMERATINTITSVHIGATVITTYQIVGGQITA